MKTRHLTLLLILAIFLFTPEVRAQLFSKKPLSPSKMCHKIYRNRTKKFKKKFIFKKQQKDVAGIRYAPYQAASHGPDYPDIEESPQLLASEQPPSTEHKVYEQPQDLPTPVNDRQADIRKKVEKKLESGAADGPILESLFFVSDEAEFAYVDFDPFLLAVEYALHGKMVLVEGFTDNRGSEDHNLALSMKRVRQIERLMLDIGVSPDNVSVIGYGEANPKYDNSTEEGRQKNRRVDFKIF